jgi:hypothetical protein
VLGKVASSRPPVARRTGCYTKEDGRVHKTLLRLKTLVETANFKGQINMQWGTANA